MIVIERISPITGRWNTMEVDATWDQIDRWQKGTLIQHALPQLSPEEREFIMSGITPNEWGNMFPEDED